jgi:hypothetical protein
MEKQQWEGEKIMEEILGTHDHRHAGAGVPRLPLSDARQLEPCTPIFYTIFIFRHAALA